MVLKTSTNNNITGPYEIGGGDSDPDKTPI